MNLFLCFILSSICLMLILIYIKLNQLLTSNYEQNYEIQMILRNNSTPDYIDNPEIPMI